MTTHGMWVALIGIDYHECTLACWKLLGKQYLKGRYPEGQVVEVINLNWVQSPMQLLHPIKNR